MCHDLIYLVMLFLIAHLLTDIAERDCWSYIGRHRSHSRALTGLEFGVLEDGSRALVSIGQDKRLVCDLQTA